MYNSLVVGIMLGERLRWISSISLQNCYILFCAPERYWPTWMALKSSFALSFQVVLIQLVTHTLRRSKGKRKGWLGDLFFWLPHCQVPWVVCALLPKTMTPIKQPSGFELLLFPFKSGDRKDDSFTSSTGLLLHSLWVFWTLLLSL